MSKLWHPISFVLKQVWHSAKIYFILILLFSVIVSLSSLVNLLTFRDIINAATGLPTLFGFSLIGVLLFRFSYEILKKIVDGLIGYTWQLLDIKNVIHLHRTFVDKVATLDLSGLENPHLVGLMNRAYSRLQFQIKLYLQSFIQVTASFFELLISFAIFALASPAFALLIIITNLIPIFVRAKNSYGVFMIYRADDNTRRQFGYTSNLITQRELLPEIKVYRAFDFIKKRLTKIYRVFTQKQLKMEKKFQIFGTVADLIPIMAMLGFSLYLVSQLNQGLLTVGSFVLYFTNIFAFSGTLLRFSQFLGQLHSDSHFIDEVREFFDYQPSMTFPVLSPAKNQEVASKLSQPTITFEDVTFRYPNATANALTHLNLTIPAGQNVALIGENGAGKTTLVKLLMRMYDPQEGRILINGVDLKDLSEELLFSLYSCLFQNFGHFYLTVKENLQLASGKTITDADMINFLKFSNAWEFIEPTSGKLNQQLGPEYENGIDLSGGQWQRLAIARAYAKQASILILDEPTSAVDAKSEMEIFDRINQKMRTNTLIFISHRFSTIKDAERIIVLDKGIIIEDGTHHRLMENQGKYAELYTLQADRYRRI
jgi:ATP-binding cassette, subfamily B, bacterial